MNPDTFKTRFKELVGNTFFSVVFEKANGDLRQLTGRLGVRRYVTGNGKPINSETVIHVWEVLPGGQGQYRSFDVRRLRRLRCRGIEINFTGAVAQKRGMEKAPRIANQIRKAA